MKRTLMVPFVLIALVAGAMIAPSGQAKGGEGGTRIVLRPTSAFAGAKGSAKSQVEGQRELEIEVEHVRRLAGKRVNFFVNTTKVGSARVNGLGAAQIDKRSSGFPAISAGTRIKVKTTGGTTIVAGRF